MIETLAIIFVVLAAVAGAAAFIVHSLRKQAPAEPDPSEARVAELAAQQTAIAARLEGVIGMLVKRQGELQQSVNERLDSVSHKLGQSIQSTTQTTSENLQKLNERLAVIDTAQKNITELASQVTSLQTVLSNKQQRGAFGQGRMEIIIQDGLPKGCYEFQYTLSNNSRPDCCILMPDKRRLVIDAKFPLEAVTAFREAKTDAERTAAARQLRGDIGKHVADIGQKYFISGETHDLALMFVPSESVYADLYEGFDDLFQKAFRARVMIVSPSLLMLAVQVIQQIQKDARMREAADRIHAEVGHLMDDMRRLHERVVKLQSHFGQANDDVRQILISSEKVQKRGDRIREVDFDGDEDAELPLAARPVPRKLTAAE